jgi:hypothetical protein
MKGLLVMAENIKNIDCTKLFHYNDLMGYRFEFEFSDRSVKIFDASIFSMESVGKQFEMLLFFNVQNSADLFVADNAKLITEEELDPSFLVEDISENKGQVALLCKFVSNFLSKEEIIPKGRPAIYGGYFNITRSLIDGVKIDDIFCGTDYKLGIATDFDITIQCLISGDAEVKYDFKDTVIIDKTEALSDVRLKYLCDILDEFEFQFPEAYSDNCGLSDQALHVGLKKYSSGEYTLPQLSTYMTGMALKKRLS